MKNFCILPWYGNEIKLATGEESICCWLTGPVDREELQREFLNDKRPTVCERCWHNEDAGIESRRMMENRFLDFKLNRDISMIEDDARKSLSKINLYQFDLGSLCNGTCVTCGPTHSTAWKQLTGRNISIRNDSNLIDKNFEKIKNQINWKSAKRINLLGGESLLIKKSFDILELLLAYNNTECRISFVTNGSVNLSQKQIDLFKKFSDINCCVSIDGIDKTFDYLRYPLKWEIVSKNLDTYRKFFKEVTVSYTISNLNYHERDNTIKWFNDNNLLFIENFVSHPEYFNYRVMPGTTLWQRFVDEIKKQDSLKGISIKDYIPYIFEIMQKE